MAIDHDTAASIQQHILGVIRDVFDLGKNVRALLPDDEWKAIAPKIAGVVYRLDLDVLEPIYREHPDLRASDEGGSPPIAVTD